MYYKIIGRTIDGHYWGIRVTTWDEVTEEVLSAASKGVEIRNVQIFR